jgi:alpha-1,3-rhamnosyl/mannosyltransferase
MRIAFDASDILGKSGIETYTRELINALCDSFPDDTFTLLTSSNQALGLSASFLSKPNLVIDDCLIDTKIIGSIGREFIKQLNFRTWRRKAKHFDIVHQTNQFHLLKGVSNLVATVHDLIPLYEDGFSTLSMREHYRKKIEQIIKQSINIIVPTEFVKKEFEQYFPGNASKVIAIHEAAGIDFKPCNVDSDFFRNFGLPDNCKYFLHVGRLFQRKNILRIVQAYAMLDESHKKDTHLVLFVNGKESEKDWLFANVGNIIEKENIHLIENAAFDDLVKFYSNALAFVFPSLSEGFGLPILEAMQCGCPVITSKASCLPEIAGNSAMLVDPYNVFDIRTAMADILQSNTRRRELIESGFIRAKEFSWTKAAIQTMDCYHQSANSKGLIYA